MYHKDSIKRPSTFLFSDRQLFKGVTLNLLHKCTFFEDRYFLAIKIIQKFKITDFESYPFIGSFHTLIGLIFTISRIFADFATNLYRKNVQNHQKSKSTRNFSKS